MLNNVSSYTGKFPFLSVKSEFHDSALLCPFTRLESQELELSQVYSNQEVLDLESKRCRLLNGMSCG